MPDNIRVSARESWHTYPPVTYGQAARTSANARRPATVTRQH